MAMVMSHWRIPYLRRAFLFAVGGGLAASFAYVGMVTPAQDTYDAKFEQMREISAQRAELDARLALTDKVANVAEKITILDQKLNQEGERSGVVERFAELATVTGVRIIHGTNRFGAEISGVSPVFHELTIEGDYLSTRAFLESARDLASLTLLLSTEMSGNPDGTIVRSQLEFVTYGRVDP